MGRRAGHGGLWRRKPLELLAAAPVPLGVWTAIVAAEAVAFFGTAITMLGFSDSPSSALLVESFLVLSLVTLAIAAIVVIVFSTHPRYCRQRSG